MITTAKQSSGSGPARRSAHSTSLNIEQAIVLLVKLLAVSINIQSSVQIINDATDADTRPSDAQISIDVGRNRSFLPGPNKQVNLPPRISQQGYL